MHREPLPHDIIRVPGSDAPERVMSVDAHTLTLAPLRGDETRTIDRPARENIRLVGVAAPGRKHRTKPAESLPPPIVESGTVRMSAISGDTIPRVTSPVDVSEVGPLTYGSSGVDPSDLF